ncbi:FAD/NAD-P-binding domain-containing protein [Trametes punicea]|nr:FAD/NAD-P-binding domain-containing protein [Trametes punicea]
MPASDHFDSHTPSTTTSPGSYTLGDFCIDEYKPIKVIVVGAGFSGLLAGIRFPQKIPNVQLTIYEKSAGVGGTWYNNNYPGLACDVAAHCYQLSFEEKRDWSTFYPSGPEVRQHLEDLTEKYKLMRYIKLQHEVVHAQYDSAVGKWHVRVRRPNPESGVEEEIEDSGDVLLMAVGLLSRWKWPDIEGLSDFKGELHHSAGFATYPKTWEEVAAPWADKKVGVVGVGSSAIQIVAALQPKVQKLLNFSRGRTWLALPFGAEAVAKLIGRDQTRFPDDLRFTPEEINRFKNDREFFRTFRTTIETEYNSSHAFTLRGTALQEQYREACKQIMEAKLAKKPWIAEKLIPDFPLSCRRLTPGPGYLEALCEDNCDLVSTPIKRVTATGVELTDGQRHDLDVLICATGYDTSYQLPFKVIGRNGLDINERWKPHAVSYLSVAVDGFPNMFMSLGPNSAIASGTLLPLIEYQVMYAVQATAKLQRERLKSIEVKPEALQDFDEYLEVVIYDYCVDGHAHNISHLVFRRISPRRTVFTEKCRSWYKVGQEEGRIVGLWPGSTLHGLRALSHPRWEDFNYELADPVQNRMYWLGDGQTYNEKTLTGDRAWYLHEPFLDVPPIPSE